MTKNGEGLFHFPTDACPKGLIINPNLEGEEREAVIATFTTAIRDGVFTADKYVGDWGSSRDGRDADGGDADASKVSGNGTDYSDH